jgi:hypothetical protein
MIDHQQEERACENLSVSAQTPAGLATTEAVVLFLGRAWNVLGVKKCHPSRMVHIKVLLLTEILQYPNHGFSPTFLLSTEILQYYPNHRFGPKSLTGTMILKPACQTCSRFTKILIVKPGADSLDSLDFRSDKSTKNTATHNEIVENGSHVIILSTNSDQIELLKYS